jgi:phosphoribosylformylglycinamidine cyclo-ligase
VNIKGIAHITGGGIEGNLIRVLPDGCKMTIDYGSWNVPPIFDLIQRSGPVEPDEMRKVFNMGVGMALVVDKSEAAKIIGNRIGELKVFKVGQIT